MAKESWYWLASGLGWGAVNSGEVLAAFPGGAEDVQAALGGERLDELLTQKQAERLAASRPEDFALRLHQAKSQGIEVLTLEDDEYPEALRSLHNPPLLLFVKGDTGLLNGQLALGMVGARRPSAYGVEAVKAIGRGVALGGAIIVSGLAAGLDSEAHKAALAVNGPTIACIAFGHNHCYPAANKKLMEVIERYGAVISEYPPDTTPEKPYFLQRNRIIAGVSHGLVVVEARSYSGTMSTVNFAVDFGRDVFAVPGSIFSELSGGTNAMIQEGAYVAASATDVLSVYGVELKGEDPVATAAKQAAEGRPAPASSAAPPWQQSIRRYERSRQAEAGEQEPLPGQQSLGELLRGQLKDTDGDVTAAQAVNAFRALQEAMPAKTGRELDARNRALDEMVEAVSDSVQISAAARRSTQKPPPKPVRPGEPQPYPWHQVERLDKRKIESLSPVKDSSSRRKPKPTDRSLAETVVRPAPKPLPPEEDDLAGASTQPPSSFLQQFAGTRSTAGSSAAGPIEPVGRVGGVDRVRPVHLVQPVSPFEAVVPASQAPPAEKAAPASRADEPPGIPVPDMAPPAEKEPPKKEEVVPQRDFVPKPVAERPTSRLRRDSSLSCRLKTMQPAGEKPKPAAGRTDTLTTFRKPATKGGALLGGQSQGTDALSEIAKEALAQLGPVPVPLEEICQNSGLSSAEAMAALTELELAGLSRQLPGRQFVIAD